MTNEFKNLSPSPTAEAITSQVQLYSDDLIDISSGTAEILWNPAASSYLGDINAEALGAIAASVTGTDAADTDFSSDNYTAVLFVDDGDEQDITLDADYEDVAGLLAALQAQTTGATWSEDTGTLTLTSDTSGLTSEINWDGTAAGAADLNIDDEDAFGVDPNNITFYYPGVYDIKLYVGVGDEAGADLADPEPFSALFAITGSDNAELTLDLPVGWDSISAAKKYVASYFAVIEAGDVIVLSVGNPAETMDRTASVLAVITRLDGNHFAEAEQPPLP